MEGIPHDVNITNGTLKTYFNSAFSPTSLKDKVKVNIKVSLTLDILLEICLVSKNYKHLALLIRDRRQWTTLPK